MLVPNLGARSSSSDKMLGIENDCTGNNTGGIGTAYPRARARADISRMRRAEDRIDLRLGTQLLSANLGILVQDLWSGIRTFSL